MLKSRLPDWRPDFAETSALFAPLRHLPPAFAHHHHWPELEDYQQLLASWPKVIATASGKPLKIVPQASKPDRFEEHYAPRIYLTGELQTRRHNWHDFFQFLSWLMFPRTKAVINAAHIPYAEMRLPLIEQRGKRTAVENMLSLFDEGGAIVVSSDRSLLDLIDSFQWKELFWRRRRQTTTGLEMITFGHGLYEKALAPYLGMTANCILLTVDEAFHGSPMESKLATLDDRLSTLFSGSERPQRPHDLAPFPLLGMPGWDSHNACEGYYDNVAYFRPGRRLSKGIARQSRPILET